MITLGINAAVHDASAALVIDGEAVAAAQEERFTRIPLAKPPSPFTACELPFNAIEFCLAHAGLALSEVDHVAYSFDPKTLPERADGHASHLPATAPMRAAPFSSDVFDPAFGRSVDDVPAQLVAGAPAELRARFRGAKVNGSYRFHYLDHQLCHQASAFLAAPFDRCAVMTLGGRGERSSTAYGRFQPGLYTPMGEVQLPHSLGLLYEQVTAHLGFVRARDEHQVMALAAQGRPRYADVFAKHVSVLDGGQYRVAAIDLVALAGRPRSRGEPLTRAQLDLAATLQRTVEDVALQLARWLEAATGESCLALSGGMALNCLMNTHLLRSGVFKDVWVQPAAGDAGTALGAALWVDAVERAGAPPAALLRGRGTRLAPRTWHMTSALLGPSWSERELEAVLLECGFPYTRMAQPPQSVAALLAEDKMIGWFQDRMEFGPRALGARSILASPLTARMQGRINQLKDREAFRPVAPVLPQAHFAEWFDTREVAVPRSPFMTFVYQVQHEQFVRIPSASHCDGNSRVQTVDADDRTGLFPLLQAFGDLTGVPVLINTAFALGGAPLVCTPHQAIQAWTSSPLDALVLGPFLLQKDPLTAT